MTLVKDGGESLESIRALINVPPKQQKFLQRDRDERSLSYRRQVLLAFDKLVAGDRKTAQMAAGGP
jgi:hypothetical protein